MSRLFDEVSAGIKGNPVVVDVTNVAAYYYISDQHYWDIEEDIPNGAAPFPLAFYEWRMPTRAVVDGREMFNPGNITVKHGALAQTMKSEQVPAYVASDLDLKVVNENTETLREFARTANVLAEKSEWVSFFWGFAGKGVVLKSVYGVDRAGKFVRFNSVHSSMSVVSTWFAKKNAEVTADYTAIAQNFLMPMFLAVSFMHCKNVMRKENVPPPKVQMRRAKEGKLPLTKYYTLEIEAMKRTLQTEGGISTNGLKRALHICRGHFATYDEKPLFGKVKGTFWIPQHVKGAKEHGQIIKDYKVKP